MGKKKNKAKAFTLVVKPGEVRVRKHFAPAARPMADKRLKPARRKAAFLAEAGLPGES